MNRRFRGSFAAVLVVASLAGCSGQMLTVPLLQSAARAVLVARTYDAGLRAARSGDRAGLNRCVTELHSLGAVPQMIALARSGPSSAAEAEVDQATLFDIEAQNRRGLAREKLNGQAAHHYRAALSMEPDFDSFDPEKLNSLGYFLAERGTSLQDFATAERLTTRALALFVGAANAAEPGTTQAVAWKFSGANTRDSVAWSLFREGRVKEARAQQLQAVRDAAAAAGAVGASVPAELYYHLAEIDRALLDTKGARKEYTLALKAKPDYEEAAAALKSLPPDRAPGLAANR